MLTHFVAFVACAVAVLAIKISRGTPPPQSRAIVVLPLESMGEGQK